MLNKSQDVRTMLALLYSRSFMRQTRAIDIARATWESWPEETREIFRDNVLVESA